MLLFSCYYSSISFFGHAHIVGGISVVHSHLGGTSEHNHTDAQYAVIDILSTFHSEYAVDVCHLHSPFLLLSELCIGYQGPSHESDRCSSVLLRGPPQC